jgi:hypothetical protein
VSNAQAAVKELPDTMALQGWAGKLITGLACVDSAATPATTKLTMVMIQTDDRSTAMAQEEMAEVAAETCTHAPQPKRLNAAAVMKLDSIPRQPCP